MLRKVFALSILFAMLSPVFFGFAAPIELPRVGRVIVVGNTITATNVICDALDLQPGQVLRPQEIQSSERNLHRLELFAIDPITGRGPTITVAGGGEFRDVLVQVKQTRTDSWRVMPGLSARGEPLVSLVWEERNFEPWRWPTSAEDWYLGRAFRGGGICFRLEVVQFSLAPRPTIRWFRWGSTLFPARG